MRFHLCVQALVSKSFRFVFCFLESGFQRLLGSATMERNGASEVLHCREFWYGYLWVCGCVLGVLFHTAAISWRMLSNSCICSNLSRALGSWLPAGSWQGLSHWLWFLGEPAPVLCVCLSSHGQWDKCLHPHFCYRENGSPSGTLSCHVMSCRLFSCRVP